VSLLLWAKAWRSVSPALILNKLVDLFFTKLPQAFSLCRLQAHEIASGGIDCAGEDPPDPRVARFEVAEEAFNDSVSRLPLRPVRTLPCHRPLTHRRSVLALSSQSTPAFTHIRNAFLHDNWAALPLAGLSAYRTQHVGSRFSRRVPDVRNHSPAERCQGVADIIV
jgi:hypothetical protein